MLRKLSRSRSWSTGKRWFGSACLSLKKYQNRWVREKRDPKILDRGKEELEPWGNDNRKRAQKLVAPEVTRIASAMSCNKELSLDEKASIRSRLANSLWS
jgi:hypothetical protein